jgi:preprotein translocase subunit SecG
MRHRLLAKLFMLALLASLVLTPVASASNDGRGLYGATNDKVVTKAGFIVIVFFATFVFVMSMIQRHLDKRKAARKAAQKSVMGDAQWRGGW